MLKLRSVRGNGPGPQDGHGHIAGRVECSAVGQRRFAFRGSDASTLHGGQPLQV